jgi:K+-transporting ATPase ATPase C chain
LTEERKKVGMLRPVLTLAVASLVICGLFFPLLVTAISQVAFPSQANGEIATVGGKAVGSYLIDNNFTLPIYFHARNDSASGVDPDITLQDAYSQIPEVEAATGLSYSTLKGVVDRNVEGVFLGFGSPYVNVLRLNLDLIRSFQDVYNSTG